MRLLVYISLFLGFTSGYDKSYGSALAVSISKNLQGTLAGRIVTRRLTSFVDKVVEFVDGSEKLRGTITQVIVPPLADYLQTGNHRLFRFKFEIALLQADDPYFRTGETRIIEFKQVEGVGVGGVGNAQFLDSPLISNVPIARLLAEYEEIPKAGCGTKP